MRLKFPVIVAGFALLSAAGHAQEFSITDLGNLGGGESTAMSVNNKGQVVGYSPIQYLSEEVNLQTINPFIYSNGTMSSILDEDEWIWNFAFAINDAGAVVGEYSSNSSGLTNAFKVDSSWHNLAPANWSYANAINENGVAVGIDGYAQGGGYALNGLLTGGIPIGVVFNNGSVLDIPKGLYFAVSPSGINDAGEISASCITASLTYKGCVVKGLTQQLLQPVTSYPSAQPNAINESSYTCGFSYQGPQSAPTATIATYWKGTAATNLGTPPNTANSQCMGMDNFGQGVGAATTKTNAKEQIGVFYDPLNGARDLNTLIPKIHIKGHSLVVQNAVSLSDTGYIAANCLHDDGSVQACLLKANPVLILKDNVLTLAAKDHMCPACENVLAPAARALPETLAGLNADELHVAIERVDAIMEEVESLERETEISQPIALLLTHNAQLVLNTLQPVRR
jgi:uncharacterized membrane protein